MDIGHTIEDCFTLRKEVAYLLKVGYRKDPIKSRGRNEDPNKTNQEQKQERNLPPPPPLYEIKFINGGSNICGLTSSAVKNIAKTPQTKSPCKPRNIPPITFSGSDLVGIPGLNYDGLVISMQIGTANIRRIFVDGGSLVNLIILDVLKAIKINEDQINKTSSVLVGFSGETKNTLGEIYLHTYVEGVASYERFEVLDCLFSYNDILGRPLIHNVKVVPSTYHQCIKIPTNWGVDGIKGEHKSAQECYTEALKPSNAAPPRKETDQVILNPDYPDRYVLVGFDAPDLVRPKFVSFLKSKSSCFTWSHSDMTGISVDIITQIIGSILTHLLSMCSRNDNSLHQKEMPLSMKNWTNS
ncbi:uncharacterized protein LOC141630920 [Silene latifolia]|uniref:uncharacterized protein LOC141630920 n=1 Tax=Silene latifolia TaxID=37657 RepID=UPI003D772572